MACGRNCCGAGVSPAFAIFAISTLPRQAGRLHHNSSRSDPTALPGGGIGRTCYFRVIVTRFDPWIFAGLLLVFGVSCAVFWAHVQRWTRNQWWFAPREWAAENSFTLHGRRKRPGVPMPLAGLTLPPPVATVALTDSRSAFLQLSTPAPLLADAIGAGPTSDSARPRRWNVLVRELDAEWPATALRPAHAETSLVDLFELAGFPALLASERFTAHGVDPSAARALAKSTITALMPKDLGLILQGRRMVLDFSGRRFDAIDLSRLLALADQLAAHLPAVRG